MKAALDPKVKKTQHIQLRAGTQFPLVSPQTRPYTPRPLFTQAKADEKRTMTGDTPPTDTPMSTFHAEPDMDQQPAANAPVQVVDKGQGERAVAATEPDEPKAVTMPDGSELGAVEGADDFEALMAQSMTAPKADAVFNPGDKVEGIVEVISLHGREVFLDLGGRATGYILKEELVDDEGNLTVKQGDKVEGIVVGTDFNGIKIRRSLARTDGDFRALKDALVAGLPVEGKVVATNKGGFEVLVSGARAFCPMSQIDLYRPDDPQQFVGKTMLFKLIELKGREAVLSRQALLKQEREEKAKELREKLKVGARLEGTVRSIQKYGAFVDLGGIDGLIHVSELSWDHGIDPHKVVKLGQKVEVVVLEIDDSRGRVALSLKKAKGDPYETAVEGLGVGATVEGTVARLTNFGAFVTIAEGVDGLIHVSDMAHHRVRHPKEILSIGDVVKVRVTEIDLARRRIGLSLKALAEDPWDSVTTRFPVDSTVTGKVESVRDFGIFVALGDGITALLPASESGVPHGQPLQSQYKVGSEVTATVLRIDENDRKMALTTRDPSEARARRGGGGGGGGGGYGDRRGGGGDRRGGDRRGGGRGRGPRRDSGPRSWMDSDDKSESVGAFGAALLKALKKDEK